MHIEYAAHRDHPITHSSTTLTIGLSLAGAAIATIFVITVTGGTAMVVLGMMAAGGSVGLNAGRLGDTLLPVTTRGAITSGAPDVFLGPVSKPAARADADDTKVNCCGDNKVAEGSKIVVIGPDSKPMSRRGDRTKCGGNIAGGIGSIMVGGEASQQGVSITEQDSLAVTYLSATWDVIGGLSTIGKRGAVEIARGTAQLAAVGLSLSGQDDAAKLLKAAATGSPSRFLEVIDGSITMIDAGRAGNNLAGGILSPSTPR